MTCHQDETYVDIDDDMYNRETRRCYKSQTPQKSDVTFSIEKRRNLDIMIFMKIIFWVVGFLTSPMVCRNLIDMQAKPC